LLLVDPDGHYTLLEQRFTLIFIEGTMISFIVESDLNLALIDPETQDAAQ